jgi:formate C-acetyltransferase
MYTLSPISQRVSEMREKYRSTVPEICLARYKLITNFYREHTELS